MYGEDFNSSRFQSIIPNGCHELPDWEGIIVDYLAGTASYLASLPYDLCVTHPNVCSMRNDMEELWRKNTEGYPAELLFNATSY